MQYEFTCSGDTSRRMSRAHVTKWLRDSAMPIVALFAAVTVALLLTATSDVRGWRSRLFAAGFSGAVITAGAVALVTVLTYGLTRLNVGRMLSAGTVMRSGFGESDFVTENPLSSARISYEAARSVSSAGGFVFIRYVGGPVVHVYPAELFPPEVIARLEQSTAAAASGRTIPWARLVIGICVLVAVLELRSEGDEGAFCDDLRRIDKAVAGLRQAKADDYFDDVPERVLALRDAYQSITPSAATGSTGQQRSRTTTSSTAALSQCDSQVIRWSPPHRTTRGSPPP